MSVTWTSKAPSTSVFPRFGFDASGGALVQFDRLNVEGKANVRYRLVADADGPIRVALLQVNTPNSGCELLDAAVNDGRYAFKVLGDQASGSIYGVHEGVIAGKVGAAAPDRVIKLEPVKGVTADWEISSDLIVELRSKRVAWSWSGDVSSTFYDPALDPPNLPAGHTVALGTDVFVQIGSGASSGVMTWSASNGLRDLLRWPDGSGAAGNFATDGHDMVWTYFDGSTYSIMSAKYSVDKAQTLATGRKLRADPGGFSPYPFVVGCGYAARQVGDGKTNDLLLVRLDNGAGWRLAGDADPSAFSYTKALGISCSDLFATAQFRDNATAIVRIALTNLPTPLPPG